MEVNTSMKRSAHIIENGWVICTADDFDIERGYMVGHDGRQIFLSKKCKVGYSYTYKAESDGQTWRV